MTSPFAVKVGKIIWVFWRGVGGGEFNLNAREIVQIDGILENYI